MPGEGRGRGGAAAGGFRVMTFNIQTHNAEAQYAEWPARRPLVVRTIERCAPDLLAMQECTPKQLGDLKEDLEPRGYAVVPGPVSGGSRLPRWAAVAGPVAGAAGGAWLRRDWERLSPAARWGAGAAVAAAAAGPVVSLLADRWLPGQEPDPGEHCPIAYRRDRWRLADHGAFWISDMPERPGSVLVGTWEPRVVNWARLAPRDGSAPVTLYSAHMDFLPWAQPGSVPVLRRRLQADWDGAPQVLAGDFNAPVHLSPYHLLLALGEDGEADIAFRDAWHAAEERRGPEATLHGPDGDRRWPGRLDHILYRNHPATRVERVTTVDDHEGELYPSDHYPVVADLLPLQGDGGRGPAGMAGAEEDDD